MRLGRVLSVLVVLLSSALVIHADSISPSDPQIIVGRGRLDSTMITKSPFGVPVDSSGGGIFNFDNATGNEWTGLMLTITFPNAVDAKAAAVSCSNGDILSNIYTDCSSDRQGRTLTITLTGGGIDSCSGGSCPLDTQFFIDLNTGDSLNAHGNPNGVGGWNNKDGKDTIEVQSLTTPEPGTLALLLTGLGGFWLRRKRT